MPGNTFGRVFRLTTFGESHGTAIGGVLDGCPAGLELSEKDIQLELDLRKPGEGIASTSRKESDKVQILSGVFEGKTTGTPIAFLIYNEDQKSRDYGNLASVFRPGHADWAYYKKYNHIRDYRGGGRSSGRETAIRVAGGAVAKKILNKVCGTKIYAASTELGGIAIAEHEQDFLHAGSRAYFAASDLAIPQWEDAIKKAKKDGETLGGIVGIRACNVPYGLGEPVFYKLDACLAFALMGVGAVKGVGIGSGFACACKKGSENNDILLPGKKGECSAEFASNHAGGILGGISTGQDICLNAAVKPIASISREQSTIDVNGNSVKINIGGRHDISAIPRIVPVLSAMVALVLADALLLQQRMDILA